MANEGIIVGIGGDTSGLQQSLNRAMKDVGKLAASIGGLVSVGATFAGIKNALDLGSEMTDLSNRTGVAVENLMGLRSAFKDAGVDANALGPAVNKMQKSLASAVAGGSEGNALKAMGLDPQALASMDPGKAFAEIGNSISQLPNATQRAAASMQIFGKSGAELLQVFMDPNFKNAGTVSNTAKLLGENAGIFDKASDSLGHIGPKLQGLFVGIASGATGLLNTLSDFIESLDLSGIGQAFGNVIGNFTTDFTDEWTKIVQFIQDTISIVFSKEGLSVILDSFYYIGAQIRDFLITVFKTPLDYMEAGIQKAMESAMEMIGKIPILGKQAGLNGFKASSFDQILSEVKDRGNGLQNLSKADAANKSETGDRIRSEISSLTEKLKKSLEPVITATDATKAANESARQANANRLNSQGQYDGSAIGQTAKTSIFADSLARIGGGGMFSAGSDELLSETKKQTALLTKIAGKDQQSGQGSATFSRN